MKYHFKQIDVFTQTGLLGNPVAVVFDADDLSAAQMQRFANWTNLSETTFLLKPTDAGADYRVRIFTPARELPFAGHPTLGSCHAWLQAGGTAQDANQIVQQCAQGLIRIRRLSDQLSFAAPPMRASKPSPETLQQTLDALGLSNEPAIDAALLDNGPIFLVLSLRSAREALAVKPDFAKLSKLPSVGLIAPHPQGHDCRYEVRGFAPSMGVNEDPVTGSLNASLAQWLTQTRGESGAYWVAQGSKLGRAGRIQITIDPDHNVWVGGGCVTCIEGTVDI